MIGVGVCFYVYLSPSGYSSMYDLYISKNLAVFQSNNFIRIKWFLTDCNLCWPLGRCGSYNNMSNDCCHGYCAVFSHAPDSCDCYACDNDTDSFRMHTYQVHKCQCDYSCGCDCYGFDFRRYYLWWPSSLIDEHNYYCHYYYYIDWWIYHLCY